MMWSYKNPVNIVFGAGAISTIRQHLAQRRYALVTYSDEPFRALRARVEAIAGLPEFVVDSVKPNPDVLSIAHASHAWGSVRDRVDVILAMGGGSAIDSAKALAAADGDFSRVRAYLDAPHTVNLDPKPIIAVPTTAGTGSEVTMWATVWDNEDGRKYSLSSPKLYAETAIVDPELTRGMPTFLTLSTGLDALSHSLESIWNRNANPVSTEFAVAAAREVLSTLPRVVLDLPDLGLRSNMARAALLAGLAFSNTKTALAHSMSYPLTLEYGVPHGIACSFTLPMVMRSAIGTDEACDDALRRIFGADLHAGADKLDRFLQDLGVSVEPSDHGVPPMRWHEIVTDALVGERGMNFIGGSERVFSVMGVDARS